MGFQYQEAIDEGTRILEELTDFDLSGLLAMIISSCYMFLGNKDEAIKWFKEVPKRTNVKHKQDAFCDIVAKRWMPQVNEYIPLLGYFVLFLGRALEHLNKESTERMENMLKETCENFVFESSEARALIALFQSTFHKKKGEFEQGKLLLLETIKDKGLPSDCVALPFIYYELGEFEYKLKNPDQCEVYLKAGSKMKGNLFDTLQNRFTVALQQLAKEKKAR